MSGLADIFFLECTFECQLTKIAGLAY